MKIYTITCSNAYNYGAVLQAYALQKYLSEKGNNVEIINYYPPFLRKITKKYRNNYILKIVRWILYAPDYRKSRYVFDNFKNKYLKTTKPVRNLDELNNVVDKKALFIAGSDQIWNPFLENGWDDAYYLKISNINKVSYAASIGRRDLPNEFIPFLKASLRDFARLSIREDFTTRWLKSEGISAETVVDPVFLLTQDQWNELAINRFKDKYIVVYALHHIQKIYSYAKKLAKRMCVKVYVISVEIKEIRRPHDKFFWNPSVIDFLSLIRDSTAVVTNSFHGASFGVIFNRPIHLFDTESNDLRISNLVKLFGLERSVVRDECEIIDNYTPYNQTKISKIIEKSKDYLNECIGHE